MSLNIINGMNYAEDNVDSWQFELIQLATHIAIFFFSFARRILPASAKLSSIRYHL